MALIAWSAAVVLLEPMVMLLGNEWQLGRVSGAILSCHAGVLLVAMFLFLGDLPLLQVGSDLCAVAAPLQPAAYRAICGWLMPRPILRGELVPGAYVAVSTVVVCVALASAQRLYHLASSGRSVSDLSAPRRCSVNWIHDCH